MKFPNPFNISSAPRRILSETELEGMSKQDEYGRKRLIANTIASVFTILLVVFGCFIIYWLFADQSFRDTVKDIVLNNFMIIVVTGFTIIGYGNLIRRQ